MSEEWICAKQWKAIDLSVRREKLSMDADYKACRIDRRTNDSVLATLQETSDREGA